MLRLILSNRWFALGWVLLVVGSAVRFAGKDGQGIQAIDQAAQQVRAQKQGYTPLPVPAPTQASPTYEAAAGTGVDPVPDAEREADEELAAQPQDGQPQ